ncbi:MAG TPA: WD40 repeat domain-containing protein, partial [Thermoanaerobaculia bacterium]
WDVRTGTVQMLLETYFSMIPLAFSPDSTHVVTTASTGFSAPIWDLRRDLRDAVITDVDGFAYADLAANGDAVVVQAKDNLIVRYDVRSRRATSCPSLIENEQASMPELTADPYIVKVSLGLSGGALIDMRRCAVLSSFPVEDLGTKLTVLPRQHRYLITRNGGVELRNFHGRSPLRRFETEKQARHSADKLTLSADGRALLVEGFDTKEGGNARRTSVWDLRTGVMRFAVAGMQAIWSPNGELIAVVVEDPDDTPLPNRFVHVIAHDARTGRQLSDFKVSLYSIQQIIFSPDSTRILSTSRDTTARVSDARTGKQMIALPGHANHATRGAFSPTGGRIVTADAKFNLRIWDAAYGRLLAVLTGHSARIDEVAFTSDGASIVSVAAPEYMGPPSPEHTEVLRWDVGLETRSVAEIDTLIRQWMPDSVRESVLPRTSAAIRAR